MKTLPKDAPALFEAIAAGAMGVETLKTRNSDRLDFVEIHVGSIAAALELAYRAGMNAEAEKAPARPKSIMSQRIAAQGYYHG